MSGETFEESPEDHGICNVRDLELVKTKDIGLVGEITRDGGDWVTAVPATDGCAAAAANETHGELGSMDTFVYVNHEGVKVDATFAGDGGGKGVEEEVHEHGLAGTDITVKVEALWCVWWDGIWLWRFAREEAGKEGGGGWGGGRSGWGRVSEELRVERV